MTRAALVLGLAVAAAAVAADDPVGFDVFSVDGQGGGWVVHRLPGRGDSLWGCADVAREPEACVQVFFEAWRTGSQLDILHITRDTQRAWVRLRATGWGDTLLACVEPETAPRCTPVGLDLWPARAQLDRVWPPYTRVEEGGFPDGDPRQRIEPVEAADLWIEAGPAIPGPVNLYACIGLAGDAPRCRVGLPNLLRIEREGLGLRRLEDVRPTRGAPSEGARIVRIDEGSAAWDAGLREGMVILGVGGFEVREATRVRELASQYPAGAVVPFRTADVTYTVQPRPRSVAQR